MQERRDDEWTEFVAARSQDLHHDAYVLTASQTHAEQLVASALAELSRERVDFVQAASAARLRMARTVAHTDNPSTEASETSVRFRPLVVLTCRQRAILLLETVDGYDLRTAARALQLSTRDVERAYAAIPPELTGTEPGNLRSLVQDFGDLAESPDPGVTLAAVLAVPPPPRRPWWTYAAAALVIALTVGTIVITQTWHNDWLRTAAGLNHAHGTHFPAYTQGYKLVAIQDIAPGPVATVRAGPDAAVAVECVTNAAITISSGLMGDYQGGCSSTTGQPTLTPVVGSAAIHINDTSRESWPVAVYHAVQWSEYPVATSGFVVQHNQVLNDIRHASADGYASIKPQASSAVVTMRGDKGHPNGTFEAELHVPAAPPGSVLVLSGLLSPTTTGRYSLLVDDTRQWSNCGPANIVRYAPGPNALTCSIFDRNVPQISFSAWELNWPTTASVPVTMTVRDALGPWTMQLVYDRYKLGADGEPVSP